MHYEVCNMQSILLIKTTAVQNEVVLTYDKVRGLYFLAVFYGDYI